jgi:aspartyl-tRNA(Asn)/glutamyl-tRNA(Gln) amidotransferase subunit A
MRPQVFDRAPQKLGVLRDYFWKHSSPDVRQAMDGSIEFLKRETSVVDVPLPRGWNDVHVCHRTIMAYDCARHHRPRFETSSADYAPQITALIREGNAISRDTYDQAVQFQKQFREWLFAAYPSVDAIVMPATPATAPGRETTGDPRFNSPWSFAGVPAVSYPIGMGSDGMPIGLQLVRPHGLSAEHDLELLSIACWCNLGDLARWDAEVDRRLALRFPNCEWYVDEHHKMDFER